MTIQNTRKQILLPLFLVVVLLAGLLLGRYLTLSNMGRGNDKLLIYPQTNKIDMLLNLINEEYVDTINKNELVEAVIPDILKRLDPHTVYIPAKELEGVNEELEGNFGGIGVQFSIQNDTVMVVSVVSGGPSEKLGILPGDRIVAVNDTSIAGIKIGNNDVMKKLRGPMGTKVKVNILRPNVKDKLNFEIVRGAIPVNSVDVSFMLTDQIGYIRVDRFAKNTYEEFITGIAKLKSQGCKKLLVDLRGNSGGFLEVAFNMINEFLGPKEMIVYTEGKSSPRKDLLADGSGTCQNMPVAVLIDEFSASASEIFAGALQDNDRGVIVGRRSFGKGLVQQQIPLPDGSAIRLTVARYYTPSGRSIQKPYENGSDDYYSDIMKRYEHGEFYQKDSIHFNDSLQYKTKEGRTVYGGGGIMPDVFIPRDTASITDYYYRLRERGALYQFALQYADMHRARLKEYKTAKDFDNKLDGDALVSQLAAFAEKKGIRTNPSQLAVSRSLIATEIKAYVARNIIDNDGFYPIILKSDVEVKAAINELEK
ncbi:MAG: S41 family peptidase [Breznakibacter sp.]